MISVIVPVYNVEKYLKRCVASILGQTDSDFELLLIDDGSTDNSGVLCDRLGSDDSRIRVFHKENGGLSDARNFGLKHIRGAYVTFIDSDDYIGPDYLRLLSEMITEYDADVATVSSFSTVSEKLMTAESEDNRTLLCGMDAFKELVLARRYGVSAWAKLFKRELLKSDLFPKGMIYEDLYTTPYMIDKDSRWVSSTSIQYYYYQRQDSIMHTISDERIRMWEDGIEKLFLYAEQVSPQFCDCVICRYINFSFGTVVNNLLNDADFKERVRIFQRKHAEWWMKCFNNRYLTSKEKARAGILLVSPGLYRSLFKLKHKLF